MRHVKHLLVTALAVLLAFVMAVPAFAADGDHTIEITNTNESISIDGKTYYAYKLFDSTHVDNAYAYTLATDNQFYAANLVEGEPAEGTVQALLKRYFTFTAVPGTTDKVNVVAKDGFDEDTARTFADEIQPFLEGKLPDASAIATGETAVINLGTDQGYYIVTGDAKPTDPKSSETVVSAVIVTNEDPNPVCYPKAGIPTLDKKITAVTEDGAVLDADGKAAVAKIGSTVSFELDSIVPDLTGYSEYTFIISDALTAGLDYVGSSFALTINGETVNIAPAINDRTFTLTIPFATLSKYGAGKAIVLTYNATINQSALTTDFENNTASLQYSNNPYEDTTNKTPDKKTYVLDINLDALKVDGEHKTTTLDGAQFKLYKLDDETKLYYVWDVTQNVVTWTEIADNANVFTTGANGNFTQQIRGLDKGTYYLLETKAPKGFNLLSSPVTVIISAGIEDDEVTYGATFDGKNAGVTNGTVDLSAAQQSAKQPVAVGTVENNSGTVLPSTGGIGTTIIYIVGGGMVLAGIVMFLTKRRMASVEE